MCACTKREVRLRKTESLNEFRNGLRSFLYKNGDKKDAAAVC